MKSRIVAILLCAIFLADKPVRAATVFKQLHIVQSWPGALEKARTGGHRNVEVRLNDGRKLKGFLADVQPDFCVLDEPGQGRTRVPYDDIKSVQWRHNAFPRGARFALLAIGLVAVLLIIVVVELRKS